jgi:flavin-dependent dehydrogenase
MEKTISLEKTVCPTLDFAGVVDQLWDVVVVGAGPTGSLAARQLARAGAKVLLVDRLSFPRWKVCGCCLNGRAISILERAGVLNDVCAAGAISLTAFELRAGGRTATLSLPSGLSISRTHLDAQLVRSAIDAGAAFLPESEARLSSLTSDYREVILTRHNESISIRGKIVLVCEGLNRRLLTRTTEFHTDIDQDAYIGAGVVAPIERGTIKMGTIFMAVGRPGYVGAVMLEDESLNLAAALDSALLKNGLHLGTLAAEVLQEAGLTLPVDVEQLNWQGTVKLTRVTKPVAARRVFVLGDASGYVEPFTGEGMGWGLSSAVACVPLVLSAVKEWDDSLTEKWKLYHERQIHGRQKWCRRCGYVLKRPLMIKWLVSVVKYCPWFAAPVIKHLNAPWQQEECPS